MDFQSYASSQIYKYAKKYGIKAKPISYGDSLIELEYKGKKKLIKQTATAFTNIIQGRICDNKSLSIKWLKDNGITNVPNNITIRELNEINYDIIKYPIVVKPLKGHGGIGVSIDIRDKKELERAFILAKENYFRVLIEEYIEGDDYRFLVIGKKVFVAKRLPASIIGNGKKSIEDLIKKENKIREKSKLLVRIDINDEVIRILEKQNYNLKTILENGKQIFVRKNANLSTGGTILDYTEITHKDNKKLALKIAKIMDMRIIAIDFLFKDPTKKHSKKNGIVIEINDTPGLRIHHPREEEIVIEIFKTLFPKFKKGEF